MSQLILHIRWPKYWSFSFSISPSNEYSELLFFRIDWFDLLAVQETLKSLLQHHSSKASILQRSAFFMDQLSHPYMTTGKAIALTRQTFAGKIISLLFNMLSRLVIAFPPTVSQGFFSIVTPAPHKHYYSHRILMFTVISLIHCDVGESSINIIIIFQVGLGSRRPLTCWRPWPPHPPLRILCILPAWLLCPFIL